MTTGPDVTATFCATIVDQWASDGVRHAVVCPGSRSTPLAIALADDGRLALHIHHDERSAGFLALGIGLATGTPAVVLTTSGTAAVELHPAVVEAHEADVPLIVATADRPPELQGVGAPQTIDQADLYGRSPRWFADAGIPDDSGASDWRELARRALAEATGLRPGPVHLNLPFREPLLGTPGAVPPASGPAARRSASAPGLVGGEDDDEGELTGGGAGLGTALGRMAPGTRGVLVAGGGVALPEMVHRLAERLGWPVLCDARSGARVPARTTVAAADALLRHRPTAEALRPEVVVRLGGALASKVVNQWLDAVGPGQLLVHPSGRRIDVAGVVDTIVAAEPGAACAELSAAVDEAWLAPEGWLDAWSAAERAAQTAIAQVLSSHGEPTEPGVARSLLAAVPDGTDLVVSSSMPVRDLEWFGAPRAGVRVLANRGANGIDGVTSTAVGAALGSGRPTAVLLGDIAFLHDTNGLLGAVARGVDLTVVVVDNDGGGIFSFLPQRDALAADRFEQLFGTPHGVDLVTLAAAHGIATVDLTAARDIGPAVASALASGGVRLVLVRTDRARNVAVHAEINAAVGAALDSL